METYSNGLSYDCDIPSKYATTATCEYYFNSTNSTWTGRTYWERTETGKLVPFGSENVNRTDRLDIFIRLENGKKVLWCACEIKERWGVYVSDYYGKEGQDKGWFLNIDKDSILREYSDRGFCPLYINLYPNGKTRIWNLWKVNKIIDIETTRTSALIKKQNINPDSERVLQNRYQLWNNWGVTINTIKGNMQ